MLQGRVLFLEPPTQPHPAAAVVAAAVEGRMEILARLQAVLVPASAVAAAEMLAVIAKIQDQVQSLAGTVHR
jgi:hypothetical protein